MRNFLKNISPKDIRTLKIGAVAAAAIILFVLLFGWFENWAQIRKSLAQKKQMLKAVSSNDTKKQGILSIVPVFEMPLARQEQEFLLRDKFSEQLKKVGINSKPLQIISMSGSDIQPGYKLIYLKCSAEKCRFTQIADLLAGLKENPYMVGIEELKFQADTKKPDEFELNLTVSSFAK